MGSVGYRKRHELGSAMIQGLEEEEEGAYTCLIRPALLNIVYSI